MIPNKSLKPTMFTAEVAGCLGVLPNFFRSASAAPGLIEELWSFAKSAYLDNPLPSLFKERLFVHLSRFCEVRYCIVRHVGFLVGEGRPATRSRRSRRSPGRWRCSSGRCRATTRSAKPMSGCWRVSRLATCRSRRRRPRVTCSTR